MRMKIGEKLEEMDWKKKEMSWVRRKDEVGLDAENEEGAVT